MVNITHWISLTMANLSYLLFYETLRIALFKENKNIMHRTNLSEIILHTLLSYD